MKRYAWLGPFLLAATLSADAPPFVVATAAGYIPGTTPMALGQHIMQPLFVAYDPNGMLYYATARQVWRLNPDWTVTLIAGNAAGSTSPAGDGGPAATASLGWIGGIAIDSQQNVYISDVYAYAIRRVTPAGTIARFAGTGSSPLTGAGSNAGNGTAPLKVALRPGPLAIDDTSLYVSDHATSAVVAFTLDGKSSRVIAGNHSSASSGDGGSAVNASIFYPETLSLANGILYINEAGGVRIRQVNLRTGLISTRIQLLQSFSTNNGNQGLAAAPDGAIYLQQSNTISCLKPNSNTPETWAGGGSSNPGDSGSALQATLQAPVSLAINPWTHELALANYDGGLIQLIFDTDDSILTVAGSVHFAGDNGPAAMAIFNGLEGIVADAQGNLYVADVGNNRIRKIDTSGIVTTIAGTGLSGFSGDGGAATSAMLNLKHAPPFASNLAVDAAGNVYVSDFGNGRIRRIDPNGIISTVAGGGQLPIQSGVPALSAAIQPGPIAIDATGNIYFANVSTSGQPAIASIYKINARAQIVPFAGAGAAAGMAFGYAACLASDATGNIYICDSANARVRQVGPNGIMTTVAGNGATPSGAISSGPAVSTAIGAPTAVASDGSGNLFIYAGRTVVEVDATGTLQTFSGSNAAPMTSGGDGGWASTATFVSIAGMTFDPSGKLYVTDAGAYVRELMPVGLSGPPPIVSSGGVIGAGASNPPVRAVSPGGIASIFGSYFSPPGAQPMLATTDLLTGKLQTNVGGVCVNIGGINAPIIGVYRNQINVIVPDLPAGPATVKVTANCGGPAPVSGNVAAVSIDAASPEFFSTPDPVTRANQVAAFNVEGGAIAVGSIVEAYGTGWGRTDPPIPPGAVPKTAANLASTATLMLGGVPVPSGKILYAGASPCCAGLYQVDFTVPDGTPSGTLPLVITVGGISSPATAYLRVQ